MAIFVASTKSISRGKGQSAVASASYRAGVELEDNRYGKTHDYSKRHGVMSADIILPSSVADAVSVVERSELWNMAEASEKRKDARVAREWLVNLPYELDEQTRKQLAHDFSQSLADRYGVIADCAIHRPTEKEIERGADARNFHAHIMLTTRQAELDENGNVTLGEKSTAELSDTKRKAMGLPRMSDEIKEVRQLWETLANDKLLEHGQNLIDSRSYEDRGMNIEPQIKMGSVATRLERDKYERELNKKNKAEAEGEEYEIDRTPVTVVGTINQIIKERNELVFNLEALAKRKVEQQSDDEIIIESRKTDTADELATPFDTTPYKQPSPFDRRVTAPPSDKNKKNKSEEKSKTQEDDRPTQKQTTPPSGDAVAQALALARAVKEQDKPAEPTPKQTKDDAIAQALALGKTLKEQQEREKQKQEKQRQAITPKPDEPLEPQPPPKADEPSKTKPDKPSPPAWTPPRP